MEIAITFDDGPHPKETAKILDVLKKIRCKGNFLCSWKACKMVSGLCN
ncbi:polysaccharide deacetylase family protein [Intestinibacter bartlettii]